jgi:hypothetical protein
VSLHLDARGKVTEDFGLFMLRLAAVYPTTGKLNPELILSYAKILGDLPLDKLHQAGARCARSEKFFPSAATLRSFLETSPDDAGLIAWASFRTAAADVGCYASLLVEDPAAADALTVVFGTWAAYCEYEEGPALHARRAEFLAAYRDAVRRGRRLASGATRLAGMLEASGKASDSPAAVLGRLLASGKVEVIQQRTLEGSAPALPPPAGPDGQD